MVILGYIHLCLFFKLPNMNDIQFNPNPEAAVLKIQDYLASTSRQILDPSDQTLDRVKVLQLFEQLSTDMRSEDKLFPTSGETLMASWELGHSSVIYDPSLDRIISHARLAQSSTHELNSQLELPNNTPRVFELGAVYTSPEFRGDKLHTSVVTIFNLYNIFCRLHCEDNIIIGTLTNAKVARLLSRSIFYGIRTVLVNHNEDPLGALTCVCEPSQPLGGKGHQHGLNACTIRTEKTGIKIASENLIEETEVNGIQISEDGSLDDGSCFMFVAGTSDTLGRFHANILNRFGIAQGGEVLSTEQTMINFIDALNGLNYYGSALTAVNEHES